MQFDFLRLNKHGVLLDIDNTIRARGTNCIPQDVILWLDNAKNQGIQFCLLSNNWHLSAYDLAHELKMPIVAKACKPLPVAFFSAAKKLELKRQEIVVVGDQIFTDVIGAHAAGMSAYLIQPLVQEDLCHTLLLRNVERALLNGRTPEPTTAKACEEKN